MLLRITTTRQDAVRRGDFLFADVARFSAAALKFETPDKIKREKKLYAIKKEIF